MDLIRLPEPALVFGHDQAIDDPRDGLTLFGPVDEGKPHGIRLGAIGTPAGLRRLRSWLIQVQTPVRNDPPQTARPPFPGFHAVFGIPFGPNLALAIEVDEAELLRYIHLDDKYQRVFKAVEVYSRVIAEAQREEDTAVDLWFIVVPDEVHRYCRPKSFVEIATRVAAEGRLNPSYAKSLVNAPSLFPEHNIAALAYHYEVNFHNQLKARVLENQVPIQIVRESTLAYTEVLNRTGRPLRDLSKLQSAIAWHIATAAFYKAGGRPWKLDGVRPGVCYIGLVFKQDDKSKDPRTACCAAQMFLDSGDGLVFKGAVGPWYNPDKGDYHLTRIAAKALVALAIRSYRRSHGAAPKELFLHGRVRFTDDEWAGFLDATPSETTLVGVRIRPDNGLKLYRKADHPILRGLAYVRDERTAYLWTKGFVPRLQTYPGKEVPNPLLVDVCRGRISIETVLRDIMGLTKLNYNACVFADGLPVTLKFADAVGEILTAGPLGNVQPLPFRHYI
jgi:hypothetical protein